MYNWERLEAVRARPGTYLARLDEWGLHQCIFEAVDNALDEYLDGFGNTIDVTLHGDGSCSVRDQGRGIPVDIHPILGAPGIEVLLTNSLCLPKSFKGDFYFGGQYSIGVKAANAFSDWFKVETIRDGKVYRIGFERGVTTQKVEFVQNAGPAQTSGTLVSFLPDATIFQKTIVFAFERVATRLCDLAALQPGLELRLRDVRTEPPSEKRFLYPDGIVDLVKALAAGGRSLHPEVFVIEGSRTITYKTYYGEEQAA